MELREITAALGIEKYPEALDEVYANLDKKKVNVCDFKLLEELETEYEIFHQYYDAVKAGMEDLQKDPIRLAWAETVATYIMDAPASVCGAVPVVPTNGTPAGDMLYMLVMLPLIPVSIEEYRRRGFPEDMIRQSVSRCYYGGINIVVERTGRPGVDKLYYGWLMHYAKAMIFNHAGFNFELKKMYPKAIYLKNKQTGQVVPVLQTGVYHSSGRVLGSLGYEDEEGSRTTPYAETEDAWYGLYAEGGFASKEPKSFPKDQWECVLTPGEYVLSIHIPRKTDMSDAAVDFAFQEGLALARKCYPDMYPKCIVCSSWLLDPTLADIIGEDSKIAKFGNRFIRYPVKSGGREVFNFVFRTQKYDLDALPENTRLERGLKKLYQDGGAIHGFQGAVL